MPPDSVKPRRDGRVDLLRGLALLMIFVDHIPGDDLNRFTLRNLGFSDAAELFVLLAGFASTMAYGGTFEREGPLATVRRVALRCLRLYVFQVGLLLLTLAIVVAWTRHFGLVPLGMAPILNGGFPAIWRALLLRAQPPDLNILPLYMVLLGLFPPFYALLRARPLAAMALSLALWLVTQVDHQFNLTNLFYGPGWFFNPFAWQFLFALGACLALILRDGDLPRRRWLIVLAWGYLAFALIEAAPWHDWGLPDLALFPLAPPDKTALAPPRLLHVTAIVYLVLTWGGLTSAMRRGGFAPLLRLIQTCGKHSLEVFSLGTLLSLVARLSFRTYGMTEPMQVAVNGLGIGAMICLGLALEGKRAGLAKSAVGGLRRA
jgi:hypothetical protein